MDTNRPQVGVGVVIVRNGKILLGKRKGSHGAGEWSFPGGHLEYGESWEECAVRETKEETGLTVSDVRFVDVTNALFPKDRKHYVTIIMAGVSREGEAELREPDTCEGWQWFEWNALPEPLFSAITEMKSRGFNPQTL